ncbi:two-component regulator propeller domain-containing protein [Alishewanella sp. HL-SH05]|uniref:two-component regulator propeller domain-containing protein n=1 Tax=Alishewanella sp. HL-SH05 TaxID=3461145 RepID=UPI004040F437
MSRFLFIIFVLMCQSALAAPPSVYDYDLKHWTSAEGLSSNSVRAITQDKLGYIWLGTLYGLNRFDGQHFEVFSNETHPKLASNAITHLLTDSEGKIWIGTKSGLSVLDPATLELQRLPIYSEVTSLLEVTPGEIWVAADQLFSVQQNKVRRVEQVKAVVSQLAQTNEQIWVMASDYLHQRAADGSWQQFALPLVLAQNPVYDLAWTDNGLHIASENGLFRLQSDGEITAQSLPDDTMAPVYRLLQDNTGAQWLSSYRKLFFQSPGQAWQTVTVAELGSSPWFSQVFQDKEHNIWLTSFSDGIFMVNRSQIRRLVPGSDPIIRSVSLTPQGKLLLASQSEVGYLDMAERFQPLISAEQLQGQTVHDLHWPGPEQLWLGLERGLYQYDVRTAQLSVLFPQLQGQAVRVVKPAEQGGIWIGSLNGLYHAQDNVLTLLPFNAELESKQITTLSQHKGQVLFGTSRGLYRWQNAQLTRLGIGSALYNAYILATLVLPDGTVLVSTLDDGVYIQRPNNAWLHLHSGNGLLHGPALSFYFHQQSGWLWLSTHKGIFRLRVDSLPQAANEGFRLEEVLSPYDRQMGSLTSRCCNGAGQSKVAFWQQQLWYPTLRGLVAVPEELDSTTPKTLRPILKKISAQQSYPLSGQQLRQVLERQERNLTISYSALEYTRPDSVIFRYQLMGFDQQWQEVVDRREAVYTNLPPGNFTFKLQVRYNYQHWLDAQETQIQLVIPRRFDETLVYRLLWLCLLLCLFYGLFWLYRQNNLHKQEQLTSLVRQRTQELENTNQKLNELNEQLSQLTHRDTTTGLRNKRFMFEQLPKDIEHFQRNRQALTEQGKTIALLLLEPDHYQQILLKYGVSTADSLLQQLSSLLSRETRGSDYVVRFVDARFVVVFRDIAQELVASYSCRLLEQIAASHFTLPDGEVVNLTASGGYALYPLPLLGGQLLNWESSMQLAEQALLQLKAQGLSAVVGSLAFASQLDAFEFEESVDLPLQIHRLLAEGLIWLEHHRL